MFDPNEPKTLREQVKELLLVLSIQPIVCGIVNAAGARFAAVFAEGWFPAAVRLAVFSVTASFLLMDAASIVGCVMALREPEDLEIKPLARIVLPLTSAVSLALLGMFFFGTVFINAAAAACGLAAMFLVMVWRPGPEKAEK